MGNKIQHPKKRAFLAAYGRVGNVTSAAVIAKIDRCTHYKWLEEDEDYAVAFAAAKEEAADWLETEAHRRAHDGVDEPVIYQGKLMGVWVNKDGDVVPEHAGGARYIALTVKKYSDTLLIFLLKGVRPEKYRERIEHSGDEEKPIRVMTVRGPTDGNGD